MGKRAKATSKKAAQQAEAGQKPNSRGWIVDLALGGVVLTAALALLLANLGNQYLWQDEAETACVARTVLTHGIPLGSDGKNFFSQDLMENLGKGYVWRLHPWLQFYVAAASLSVFGSDTFAARLPFTLFGAATVLLSFFYARFLWGTRRAGLVVAVLLLTNLAFLILSRQCRYFPLSAFFALAGLYSYGAMTAGKRRSALWFLVSSLLLFHTQYTQWIVLMGTVVIHATVFHRDTLKRVLLLVAVNAVLCVPWLVWLMGSSRIRPGEPLSFALGKLFLGVYLETLGRHVFGPMALVVIPVAWLAVWIAKRRPWLLDSEGWRKASLLLAFSVGSILIGCAAAPQPWIRYITPVVAISFLLLSGIIEAAFRAQVAVGALALAAMLVPQLNGPMRDYYYEITHDYDGPSEGMVKLLKRYARPDDIVAITYGDMPLKFYTNLRIVGGLTGEDLNEALDADWVIIRKNTVSEKDAAVKEFLMSRLPLHAFEAIEIPYPDIPFENREDPKEHMFKTAKADNVIIFRKIDPARPFPTR